MKRFSYVFEFLLAIFLSLLLSVPQGALAQSHVISPADLQKDVAAASASREQQVAQLESFLSTPQARQALKSAHVTYQQVDNAVHQLNSDDLARLSARSARAQQDFAAGRMSDRDLIIILIAIVAVVLIIVAVR